MSTTAPNLCASWKRPAEKRRGFDALPGGISRACPRIGRAASARCRFPERAPVGCDPAKARRPCLAPKRRSPPHWSEGFAGGRSRSAPLGARCQLAVHHALEHHGEQHEAHADEDVADAGDARDGGVGHRKRSPVTSTTPRTSIMHTVTTRPTLYTM